MTERWARPVIPVLLEKSTQSVWMEKTPDGVVARSDYNATLTKDDTERVRLGYVCLRCWEPHEVPFPDECSLCGYAMRDYQARDFALEWEGERHVGPSRPMQDYLDENYEVRKNPLHFDPNTGRPTGGDFTFKRKGIYVPSSKMAIPGKKKR